MRIKFVLHQKVYKQDSEQLIYDEEDIEIATYVNMSFFLIKHYYDLKGHNKNLTWLPADLISVDPLPEIIESVIRDKPDILALSVFIWNEDEQHQIAKAVKEKYPETLIVMGGPQLATHKDPEFFQRHPYVDYVVYGDGEKAFQQIVDYHGGFLPDDSQFVNIVRNNKGVYKLYPWERFTDEDFLASSPYLAKQDLIRQHVQAIVVKGVPRNDFLGGYHGHY